MAGLKITAESSCLKKQKQNPHITIKENLFRKAKKYYHPAPIPKREKELQEPLKSPKMFLNLHTFALRMLSCLCNVSLLYFIYTASVFTAMHCCTQITPRPLHLLFFIESLESSLVWACSTPDGSDNLASSLAQYHKIILQSSV